MYKQGWIIGLCFVATFGLTKGAMASALGAPVSYEQVGIGVSLSWMSIDEPEGSADDPMVISPFNLVYTNKAFSDYNYWIEGFLQSETTDPSTSNVGQDVERLGIRASIISPVPTSKITGLWAGFGGYLARETYSTRHTVDNDGFLLESYEDRKETVIGIQAELMKTWSFRDEWDFALRSYYALPLMGDGASEFVISGYFLRNRW